jgi:hypothetical protein
MKPTVLAEMNECGVLCMYITTVHSKYLQYIQMMSTIFPVPWCESLAEIATPGKFFVSETKFPKSTGWDSILRSLKQSD